MESGYHLSVCMLASGSKGNSIFISDGTTSILVDAGLSGIEIERRLKSIGKSPGDLNAVLVSHEHDDHIRGVGILSRRFHLPVYISRKTEKSALSGLKKLYDIKYFECGSGFKIKTFNIHPFSIPHDAEDPAGFTISQNGTKIGVATDLGMATSLVKEHLKGCSVLILEANHDPEMLMTGPYPWHLKQRIRSRTGHLSNEASGNLLLEVQHEHLSHVILAHLSETNNTPEKALNAVKERICHSHIRITVAAQNECSGLFYL